MRIDNFDLDKVVYGYSSEENTAFMNNKSIFDKYYLNFLNTPFPANSSDTTKNELNEIAKVMNEHKDNKAFMQCDRDINVYYLAQLKKAGINISEDIINLIIAQIAPIIMRLKHFYQRARPFQTAWYHEIPVFPKASLVAESPSYPSGHGGQSRFLVLVLAEIFPEKREWLIQLSEYVALSRLGMGVHYKSDNTFGQAISEYCSKQPEFAEIVNLVASRIQ